MKVKMRLVVIGLSLLLTAVMSGSSTYAQRVSDDPRWKTGMFTISRTGWAGEVRLEDGVYHVKHVMDGNAHAIVFRRVRLPAGKGFPMWEGKEIVRIKCLVEPVAKVLSNTKITWGRNASGERVIEEIQIAGERFKHVLLTPTSLSE